MRAYVLSRSVVSDSFRPLGLQPTRLLCSWDYPRKNTGIVAIPFSRASSQPRDQTWVSCIAGGFFTICAIREAPNIYIYTHTHIFMNICINGFIYVYIHICKYKQTVLKNNLNHRQNCDREKPVLHYPGHYFLKKKSNLNINVLKCHELT